MAAVITAYIETVMLKGSAIRRLGFLLVVEIVAGFSCKSKNLRVKAGRGRPNASLDRGRSSSRRMTCQRGRGSVPAIQANIIHYQPGQVPGKWNMVFSVGPSCCQFGEASTDSAESVPN